MVKLERIVATDKFQDDVKKIRDRSIRGRIGKEVRSVLDNPDSGKPLQYGLKGERTRRIKPYRLIYKVEGDTLILLRFEHRKDVYD